MYHITQSYKYSYSPVTVDRALQSCDWKSLRAQLMQQWHRVSADDLDEAGPYANRIAVVIQRKYGIASELVENYINNIMRTLPLTQ